MATSLGNVEDAFRWQLALARAEAVMEQALAQREADRANPAFAANDWARISVEVYAWKRAKTYLAAILCGLVARATDGKANPLSLQVGDDEGFHGYAATSLWQTIQVVAQGRIDLQQLKSQPFNNSPFSGKRYLSTEWENVASYNRPVLARTVALMERVSEMSQAEAASALRSFLWAVPDAPDARAIKVDLADSHVDLLAFFESLERFLLDDGENGRRAQAMVAASLAMVHPNHIDTPQSVNDPSRTLPGDVRVVDAVNASSELGLFAEAKQKVTPPEWVDQFADELNERRPDGVSAYAALVNERVLARSRRAEALPGWREILRDKGVLMTVWDNPSDMVREALIWSGLNVTAGVGRFVTLYAFYLRHVEAGESTVQNWVHQAKVFGVAIVDK